MNDIKAVVLSLSLMSGSEIAYQSKTGTPVKPNITLVFLDDAGYGNKVISTSD